MLAAAFVNVATSPAVAFVALSVPVTARPVEDMTALSTPLILTLTSLVLGAFNKTPPAPSDPIQLLAALPVPDPLNVKAPVALSVVNAPVLGVVAPTVPLNVPVIPANVDAPVTFKVVPTYNAFAIPTPPAVMIEPVVVLVASVTKLLLMPCANGILAVAVVCPSFVIAVDRPVPRSEVKALKAVEEMTVPVTTGWPAVFILKVPLPL